MALGLVLLSCALAGCAAMSAVRPKPPVVSVAGVRPLNLSLTKQRLRFRLLVENPNAFDLPVDSLDFVAKVGDERIARGSSDEPVVVPANGEAELSVDVTAGIDTVMDRVRSMLKDRTIDLDYRVDGTVKLANWPKRIPFDVDGTLENPLKSRSKPVPAS